MKFFIQSLRAALSLGVFLVLWGLGVLWFQPPEYLTPHPFKVFSAFKNDFADSMMHTATTGMEAFAGFSMALLLAAIMGILFFRLKQFKAILLPWLTALQSTPVIALAPLLVVWFGSGMISKVVMAAIISFFPMLMSILTGFSEVDRDAKALFKVYKVGYVSTLRYLLFPAALPVIVSGMKVSASLSVVGAIVAEFTGSDNGLGHMILNASYRLDTPKLFVGLILSGVLGYLAYTIPDILRVLFPKSWQKDTGKDGL